MQNPIFALHGRCHCREFGGWAVARRHTGGHARFGGN